MQKNSSGIISNLNWFILGVILSIPFSLPGLITAHQLAKEYGAGIAIGSILVGNLILWLMGISVVSMAIENRSNAIENVKSYLGKYGAAFMWAILITSIVNWFMNQISGAIPSVGRYFAETNPSTLVRLGAGLGFFTTLLSIGGLRIIKWAMLISSPFVFSYYLFTIGLSDYSIGSVGAVGLSIPAIMSTITMYLPGILNLPTLFRYGHSKADCYIGLTIMTLLISFFEITSIWMQFTDNWTIFYGGSKHSMFSMATLLFILCTTVLINLLNIYYASACWETYVPRFEGAKGCVIIGLMGTAAYTFIQVGAPVQFLANLTNCYLASLVVVLLMAYLVGIIVKHRPRKFEKILNGLSWLVGCLVSTIIISKNAQDNIDPLLMGVGASAFVFVCIIFIEENVWAMKKTLLGK